jgi:YggT family protein
LPSRGANPGAAVAGLRASLSVSQVFAFPHRAVYQGPGLKGRNATMDAIFWLIGELIHLYILAIIAAVVISMLISFGVVDGRNRFVYTISDFLNRLTDPVLMPIRRMLPNFGAIDISPVIAILLLEALQLLLADLYTHLVLAGLTF